jgi:TPR repeat protein
VHNVAFFYQEGIGVEKDYGISFDLFKKAAHKGISFSMFRCFVYISRGMGVERNINQALKYLQ